MRENLSSLGRRAWQLLKTSFWRRCGKLSTVVLTTIPVRRACERARACEHACVRVGERACVRVGERACERVGACVWACVWACVRACERVRVRVGACGLAGVSSTSRTSCGRLSGRTNAGRSSLSWSQRPHVSRAHQHRPNSRYRYWRCSILGPWRCCDSPLQWRCRSLLR